MSAVLFRTAIGVALTVTALSWGLAGCDDAPPPIDQTTVTSPSAPPPTPPPAAPPPAEAAQQAAPSQIDANAEVEDEPSQTNRDPFNVYEEEILTRPVRTAKIQRKVKLGRYAIDELQLIAVVTGMTRPQAMFRDPSGLGTVVWRGDYISKSTALVKAIEEGKVIVEIQQGQDRQRVADRVIRLHTEDLLQGE